MLRCCAPRRLLTVTTLLVASLALAPAAAYAVDESAPTIPVIAPWTYQAPTYSCTTLACCPTDLSVNPTSTDTTITIRWATSTDDTGVSEYVVFRDGNPLTRTTTATTYTDTGVWPHSTHNYSVAARDAAGHLSKPSPMVTAWTQVDKICPSPKPTLAASLIGRTAGSSTTASVKLNWTASTDDAALSTYKIYRNLVLIAEVSPTTLTWTDTAAPADGFNKYMVEAHDFFFNSTGSNQVQVSTDVTAPAAPADLRVTGVHTSDMTLAWTAPATDPLAQWETAVTYTVYRYATKLGPSSASLIKTETGGTTFVVSFAPGTSYSYYVVASDANGNIASPSNTASATSLGTALSDTTAPSTPLVTVANAVGSTHQVNVSWTASTDNSGGGVTYLVLRDGVQVANIAATTWVDKKVSAVTRYTYRVIAVDSAGNRSAAGTAAITTPQAALRSTVSLVVTNASGAAVAGALVTLDGSAKTCTTGLAGKCSLTGYFDGSYTVKVAATGYAATSASVGITVGQASTLPVTLR